jgi:hypothetical protein
MPHGALFVALREVHECLLRPERPFDYSSRPSPLSKGRKQLAAKSDM